jgi:Ca-activated chloride channel family protein
MRGAVRLGPVAIALTVAWAPLASRSQTPEPPPSTFRAGVQSVAVYATALDRYGEMVVNLHAEDFEILDNGRPQRLSVFQNGLQRISAILLLDTSASMTLNLDLAQSAAEQFMIRMLPGDVARVGSFSDRIDLSRAFTGDRDVLLKVFRTDLHIGNPTRLWDAIDQTMTELAPLTGRRVVMLLSDGMDTASVARPADVLARVRAEDLMIYVVQFRANARANLAEMPLSPTAGQVFSGDTRFTAPQPTQTLRTLATTTGGGHFLLSELDDINTTFTHVMQELHYQYVLGFVPERLDGALHDLVVRVKKPGVTVRARRSYRAPTATPP